MAVVVSTVRGHDASYPFKTTGAAEGPAITGRCGTGYCLSTVQKGGEPAETRRFRFEWAYRPASKGRVITGFPEKAMDRFSSRRAQITKTALALADQSGKDSRHAPDERALASMRRFANAMTRRAQEPGALNFTALRGWERASRVAELGDAARARASHMARSTTRKRTHRSAWCHTRRTRTDGSAARAARGTHARGPRATTDAATRGRGWRLDGRSG